MMPAFLFSSFFTYEIMDLKKLKIGYRLTIGSHSVFLSESDLSDLRHLLPEEEEKPFTFPRRIRLKHLIAMPCNTCTVARMNRSEWMRVRDMIYRYTRTSHIEMKIEPKQRKHIDDDPDAERDFFIYKN